MIECDGEGDYYERSVTRYVDMCKITRMATGTGTVLSCCLKVDGTKI